MQQHILRLSGTTLVAVVAAFGVHVFTQGTASTLADCTVPAMQGKAPAGTTVTSAKIVDAKGEKIGRAHV